MKVLSMYLPQFHKVLENDLWWGQGFTDWVSAQQAKVIYEGHYQPHVPLNNNYYDLMEKTTMQWQVELMNKYGIDGQCFYHYWFKDSRMILEKPAENLLKWKDINMPFCFCWANETWARSWSKIKRANVWVENFDNIDNEDTGILLEQNYGTEEDWKVHFEYLLPFFCDERYIKKDNMPIFLIYRSNEIYCLEAMIDYFNLRIKEFGFVGVYFICANSDESLPDNVNAALIHEPQNTLRRIKYDNSNTSVKVLDYSSCWEHSLKMNKVHNSTYYEAFTGYDDTPRRGNSGTVIENSSPELFEKYMRKLFAKSKISNNDFVFINAWNEWGEGMHLEPDQKNEYRFLEALKNAKDNYCIEDFEIENNSFDLKNRIKVLESERNKFERYLNILDLWMALKEKKILLEEFFKKKNYKQISIYGFGIFARHLIDEFNKSEVTIIEIIDKQNKQSNFEIPVVLPENSNLKVDVIVVTAFYYYKEIKCFYSKKNIDIISIEDVIKEVCYEKKI